MKGLLYKEFLSLKKYLNALGLLLVLYFGISVYSREVSFFAGFSAMAAVIVTFSALHTTTMQTGIVMRCPSPFPAKIWCRGGICLL